MMTKEKMPGFNFAKLGAAQRRSKPSAELLDIARHYDGLVNLPYEASVTALETFDPLWESRGYNIWQVMEACHWLQEPAHA